MMRPTQITKPNNETTYTAASLAKSSVFSMDERNPGKARRGFGDDSAGAVS